MDTALQQPSVGRIIHYVSRGSADGYYPSLHRAGIITEVIEGMKVSICVFNPQGYFFAQEIEYDEAGSINTWHYPERV